MAGTQGSRRLAGSWSGVPKVQPQSPKAYGHRPSSHRPPRWPSRLGPGADYGSELVRYDLDAPAMAQAVLRRKHQEMDMLVKPGLRQEGMPFPIQIHKIQVVGNAVHRGRGCRREPGKRDDSVA